jgi:hypothetical protein
LERGSLATLKDIRLPLKIYNKSRINPNLSRDDLSEGLLVVVENGESNPEGQTTTFNLNTNYETTYVPSAPASPVFSYSHEQEK